MTTTGPRVNFNGCFASDKAMQRAIRKIKNGEWCCICGDELKGSAGHMRSCINPQCVRDMLGVYGIPVPADAGAGR